MKSEILEIIKKRDGIKAREIALALKVDKKEVNSILYNELNDICWKDSYNRWHIINNEGNNQELIVGNRYSRQMVHDLFEPETNFQVGCGAWGLRGIVRLKNSKDYVFFVTYGSEQAGHEFREGISENGILTWQSQPNQDFESTDISNFINHDEKKNSIYLFKRNNKYEQHYTYEGKLKYISHDPNKTKPVWFEWQIIDWKNNNDKNITDLEKAIQNYRNDGNKDNLIKLFEEVYKELVNRGFSIEDFFNYI